MELTKVAEKYNNKLSKTAREWLNGRGITDATIETQILGEVVSPVQGHSRYEGAVSIPYLNPDRTVRSIRFRYLRGSVRKYDSVAGVPLHIYNVANTTAPKVWICEGEFDSLILTQLGFPAVGIPGVMGFKPHWKYLFANCEQVSIVMDGDDAGRSGANRCASMLGDVLEGELRVLLLPPDTDVTDVFQANPEELIRLVR